MTPEELPDWLKEQVGRRYRATNPAGYLTKPKIIRRFAKEQVSLGRRVDHGTIRQMLAALGRGYSTSTKEISAALSPLRDKKIVESFPNGRAVMIQGERHRSVREAARKMGVAVETVRRRVGSSKFPDWTYADHAE